MSKIRAEDTYKAEVGENGEVLLSVYSPAEDMDGNPIHTLARTYRMTIEQADCL